MMGSKQDRRWGVGKLVDNRHDTAVLGQFLDGNDNGAVEEFEYRMAA